MAVNLLPYQRQGLGWMISSENPKLPETEDEPSTQFWKYSLANGGSYVNEATKFATKTAPDLFRGGILADDMGLGKTIQCLSLIQYDRESLQNIEEKPTLIVCPLAVLMNWSSQIEMHFRPEFRPSYLVLHGTKVNELVKEIKNHEIIITTYGNISF